MKYKSHTAGKTANTGLVGELEKRLLRCSRCKTVTLATARASAAHPRHKLRCAKPAQMAAKGNGPRPGPPGYYSTWTRSRRCLWWAGPLFCPGGIERAAHGDARARDILVVC